MTQLASKGRYAADIASQPNGRGVKIRRNGDRITFGSVQDRFDIEVLGQNLSTRRMDRPHGSADLRIVIRADILTQEINQPPFALQECQKADSRIRRGPCRCRCFLRPLFSRLLRSSFKRDTAGNDQQKQQSDDDGRSSKVYQRRRVAFSSQIPERAHTDLDKKVALHDDVIPNRQYATQQNNCQ